MHLDDINVFLQVAESGSLSRAAKLMHRPKATVSHNLRRLERNLGMSLLDRENNRMRLNEAGRMFMAHARDIRRACEAATESMCATRDARDRQLRIASTSEFASNIMSSIFMDFARDQTHLEIRAMTHPRDVLSELRAQYDCIIHLGEPLADDFPEMTRRALGHFNYKWFASSAYLETVAPPASPDDLAGHKLLVQLGQSETQVWRTTDGEAETAFEPRGAFVSNDPWIVKLAAVHGHGICFMPTFFARQEVAAGMLTPVLPAWSSRLVGVYALFWTHRAANPNLALLLQKATANFGQIDRYLYRAEAPERNG